MTAVSATNHSMPRSHTFRAVTTAILVAVASSRSEAQSGTDPALGDGTASAQRVPQPISRRAKGDGPIVVPQVVLSAEAPTNGKRGQAGDRPKLPPQTPSENRSPPLAGNVPALVPDFLPRTNPDRGPNMAAQLHEPAASTALYGATHFSGATERRGKSDGFFGAPPAGVLTGGCGARPNGRRQENAIDRCMQALAFAVTPPPATRAVLPQNLPRIAPRDAQPIPPVAADKPMTPPAMEVDPYEPTGFTAGNFVIKPAVEMTTGYDSNPARVPGGKGSPFVVVAPVVAVRSQFDRHQLNADLRAAYVDDTQLQQLNHPTVDAHINGRYDFTDTTALNGEGHFMIDADDPGTARFAGNFARIPLVSTTGGSAGVTQKFDPLEVSVKGAVDHVQFQNVTLTDGQTLSNQDRNFNQYAAQSRISYSLTNEYRPFIDVAVDRRVHELPVDMLGFRRDSTGTAAEAGVTFALGDKLTGDAAIGYLVRQYQDAMLRPVSGFIADANLAYRVNKETTLQFGAKSQVAEIAEAGISGVLKRDVTAELDHQFEPWLVATLMTGYGNDVFVGSPRIDNRYFVDIGMQYKVSRNLQLKANLRQETTRSNTPVNNLNATVVSVGARVQY
jgi:hypothetical protein